MAMIACAKKAKNKSQEIKLRNKDVQSASSNGKVELSDSSLDEEFQGVVQADFVFFPKPGDFHGVKVLLQTYLDHKKWDLSGFVDLVLGQTTVGSVVKIENDEDRGVYSVVTVLNLERYKPTEDLQNSFRFKTYIVIIKIYKHKNADQNTGKTRNGDEVVIYIKPEDEILLELSSLPFCFLLHAQQVTTSELKNYILTGLVMVVDANKVV